MNDDNLITPTNQGQEPQTTAPELPGTDSVAASPAPAIPTETPAPAPAAPNPPAAEQPPSTSFDTTPLTPDPAPLPPQPMMQTPESASNQPQLGPTVAAHAPKKRKLVKILVIITALFFLFGGSAAAYVLYYLPNKPENVLLQALANTTGSDEIKSAKFDGELKIASEAIDIDTVAFDGAVSESGDTQVNLEMQSGLFSVNGEIRVIDGSEGYVKISGIGDILDIAGALAPEGETSELFELLAPALKKLDDKWIAVPLGAAGSPTQATELSDEEIEKVQNIYLDNSFLEISEIYANEQINGVESYHYALNINYEKLKSFLSELKNANVNGLSIDQSMIDGITEPSAQNTLEVWINKENKIINQVVYKGSEGEDTLELRVTITELNPNVTVDKPSEARSLQDLLQEALTAEVSVAPTKPNALLTSQQNSPLF